ncbi:hypothetical protein L3X38_012308 [Prunus dulcis]|uniref:Uncharacterized protein n=1 Tax=Prunus dulcis TaxID=3755 RepID=A0AAD4WLH8_PRUDU|nr:hypothetical protein L3X38_012308 [Prunus dulcis]
MEEVQTSFDKILTLTAKEADPLVIEEEYDGVAQDILERSLVAKIYSPKPIHKKSFKNGMLEFGTYLLLFIASSGISASAKRTGRFLNQSKMQDLVSNNGNNQLSRYRRLS